MSSSTNNENYLNSTFKGNSKNLDGKSGKNILETEEILPYCMAYLTPAMIKEAETHLHETEETKTRCLREFRNFIQNQKNLVTPTDDLFLLAFLRARKHDSERTYQLFLNFWKFRKDYRSYYENINVERVLAVLSRDFLGFLEHRDKNGACVVVYKIGQWNPESDPFEILFLAITAILLLSLEHDANLIAGIRVIWDFRGLSWTQMKYCTPSVIKILIKSTQFSFPARFKGIHFIMDSTFFRILWALAYPMLSRKLKNRVFFHSSDLKPIRTYIHPSVLPAEFGGDAPAFETTEWKSYFCERIEKLLIISRCGYKDL